MFGRRGLAAHRRMRHGPGSPAEAVAAEPVRRVPDLADTVMIARAIESLTQVVGRLDTHLDQILALKPVVPDSAAGAVAPATTGENKRTLTRELDALLAEISRLRSTCADAVAARAAAATPIREETGQKAELPSAEQVPFAGEAQSDPDVRKRLGKLRRRQAAILSRLLEMEGDPGADELGYL